MKPRPLVCGALKLYNFLCCKNRIPQHPILAVEAPLLSSFHPQLQEACAKMKDAESSLAEVPLATSS